MPKSSNVLGTYDRIVRVPFKYIYSGALTAGAANFALVPTGLGTRVSQTADGFEFYRVTEYRYRLLPGGANDTVAGSYIPGITDAGPSDVTQMAQSPLSVYMPSWQVVPTGWVSCKWRDLKSYFPWYKSVAGSTDPAEEQQGSFYLRGTGTDPYILETMGIVEFRGPINTGSTPALSRDAVKLQKERLLKILSYNESSPPGKAARPQTGIRSGSLEN